MSTTSVVPQAIDSLLTLLNAGFTGDLDDVVAFEAWPGPDAVPRMLCFGEVTWPNYKVPTIKAGRKYRDEEFNLGFEVFVFLPDGATEATPSAPKPIRDEAFDILAVLEDALANDPRAGLANDVIQWAELRPQAAGPRLFEKAYAYRVAGVIVGRARLT